MSAVTPILTFPRRGGRDLFRGYLEEVADAEPFNHDRIPPYLSDVANMGMGANEVYNKL